MAQPLAVGTSTHWWFDAPKGSILSGHVPFRFCSRCDREERVDGVVRPGIDECAPIPDPADLWEKTDLGEGLRQDLWHCLEPDCHAPSPDLVPESERAVHRLRFHDARDEPGLCGECNRPDQFAWDITQWIDDGPVIACLTHKAPGPGWVYDLDVEVAHDRPHD